MEFKENKMAIPEIKLHQLWEVKTTYSHVMIRITDTTQAPKIYANAIEYRTNDEKWKKFQAVYTFNEKDFMDEEMCTYHGEMWDWI